MDKETDLCLEIDLEGSFLQDTLNENKNVINKITSIDYISSDSKM